MSVMVNLLVSAKPREFEKAVLRGMIQVQVRVLACTQNNRGNEMWPVPKYVHA